MSQNSLAWADDVFPTVQVDLRNILKALSTRQAGAAAPSLTSGAGPNAQWINTTEKQLRVRDNADSAWYIWESWAADRGRLVTGTTDTVLNSDCRGSVIYQSGSAVAVTLPAAAGSFAPAFEVTLYNLGTADVTITAGSNINGAGTLTLKAGQGAKIISITGGVYIAWIFGDRSAADVTAAVAAAAISTGTVMGWTTTTAPSGWLILDGGTIGDGSSGATSRANADTSALFTHLWNNFANTELAVLPSGHGASAAADFAAHKTIALPDARGRNIIGKDTTGARVTVASGVSGNTLGKTGGNELMQAHTHPTTIPTTAFSMADQPPGANPFQTQLSTTTGSTGSGNTQNMPPFIVLNWIIKL